MYSAKRMLERLGMEPQQQPGKDQQKEAGKKQQQPQTEQSKQAQPPQKESAQTDKQQTGKEPDKTRIQEKEAIPEEVSKGASKIIEQVVEPDSGESWAINKDLLTEEQRKKKKGFNKQWEM